MDGFAQASRGITKRDRLHIIPHGDDERGRALCGYRPRSVWGVVIGMGGWSTAPSCEPCRATHGRVLRRTDGGSA